MKPSYLSEEYFALYTNILKAAKTNRIGVILYDVIDFPSGSADGRLAKNFPGITRKIPEKRYPCIREPANQL